MTEDRRSFGGRPRPRKPTPAERRDRRGTVEDVAEVLDSGARFLEARPRSIEEVRRKLLRLGYRTHLVEAAVERLQDLRYLDDDAFARAWIESRDRAHPRGEHALRRELELKGIERALIDAVLEDRRELALAHGATAGGEQAGGPDDAAAERLLGRRLPSLLREPDLRRRRQRAYALLARSGFSPGVCSAVTRRVLADAVLAEEPGDDPG